MDEWKPFCCFVWMIDTAVYISQPRQDSMFWWQLVYKLKCAKTYKNSCLTSHVLSFSLRDSQIWLLFLKQKKILFFWDHLYILTIIGARCLRIDNKPLFMIIHSLNRWLLYYDGDCISPLYGAPTPLNRSEICKNLSIFTRQKNTRDMQWLSSVENEPGKDEFCLCERNLKKKKDNGRNTLITVTSLL